MFLHLASTQHWVVFWPDIPHKFQRKQASAVACCPSAKSRMRALMRVFRSSRAPFATSRFGKSLREARVRLITALKADPGHELLEMFLPGIARDLGIPDSEMSAEKAIAALNSRSGRLHVKSSECKDVRWGAWVDHAQAWDKDWHMEQMCQLFHQWESGQCPWTGTTVNEEDVKDDRVFSVMKLRWQASLGQHGTSNSLPNLHM